MNVVEKYGHAVTWSFRKADVPRNHGFKDLGTEEAPEIRGDLLGKSRPVVVHREKDTFNRQGWINGPAQAHERVEKLRDTFESQVFALDRHKDGIASGECIYRKEIERRRAIDQDVFVFLAKLRYRLFEPILAILHVHELDGSADEVLVRRDELKAVHFGIEDDPFDRFSQNQVLIEGAASGILGKTKSAGCVGLWIRIYDQCALFRCCERGAEVYGRRGLANTALLIGDGDDSCQEKSPSEVANVPEIFFGMQYVSRGTK